MSRRSNIRVNIAAGVSNVPGGRARGGKAGSSSSTSPMPPAFYELDPKNPANLKRSLERNDFELAALSKLHLSLRILREAIVEEYGEDVLIEISVKGSQNAMAPINELDKANDSLGAGKEKSSADRLERLSSAFLLRMKLRRRLLNRLARRLHRVAHVMDGQNAQAPYPPMYGDQVRRFADLDDGSDEPHGKVIYDDQVKEFDEKEQKIIELRSKLEEQRQKREVDEVLLIEETGENKVKLSKPDGDEEEHIEPAKEEKIETDDKPTEQEDGNEREVRGEGQSDAMDTNDASTDETRDESMDVDNELTENKFTDVDKEPTEEKSMDADKESTEDKDFATEATTSPNDRCIDKPSATTVEPYSNAKVNLLLKGDDEDAPLLNQMVEFDVGYDKVFTLSATPALNPSEIAETTPQKATAAMVTSKDMSIIKVTKPITETIDDHEVNEEGKHTLPEGQDVPRIPFLPTFIGQLMGRDRGEEWKRWVKEICNKIPDQVTFEDLRAGDERSVFQLELRLERAKSTKRKRQEDEAKEVESHLPNEDKISDESASGETSDEQMKEVHATANRGKGKVLRRKDEVFENDSDEDNAELDDEKSTNRGKGKVLCRKDEDSEKESDGDNVEYEDDGSADSGQNKKLRLDNSRQGEGQDSDTDSSIDGNVDKVRHDEGIDKSDKECEEENEHPEEAVSVAKEKSGEEAEGIEKINDNKESKHESIKAEDKVKAEIAEDESNEDIPPKGNPKFFSLLPVPSFHDQDLFRIRNLQREVILSEKKMDVVRQHAKKDTEYKRAYEKSTDLNNKLNVVQQNLNKRIQQNRLEVSSLIANNKKIIANARALWQKRHYERQQELRMFGDFGYNARNECKGVLQGMVDRVVVQSVPVLDNTPRSVVASVLREMTDSVDRRSTEAYANYPQFVEPKYHTEHTMIANRETGETMAQMHHRLESQLKTELIRLRQQFAKAEEHRTICWNVLQKAKAELNMGHMGTNPKSKPRSASRKSGGGNRAVRPTPSAPVRSQQIAHVSSFSQAAASSTHVVAPATHAPPQNMAASLTQIRAVKQEAPSNSNLPPTNLFPASSAARNPYPSTVNVPNAAASVENQNDDQQKATSLSKYGYGDRYSLDNVNARKLSDGTVIPVTAPKQLDNGLFARPAGRQRKGMDWDAVRGFWVPEGTLPPGHAGDGR